MTKAERSFNNLVISFRKAQFEPLYFWYGTEPFFMDRLQEVLISSVLDPSMRDFNLDIVSGPDMDAEDVLAYCRSFPMMAPRRVVVVRNFEQLKGKRLFARYAKQPNHSAVVALLTSGRPSLRNAPYTTLSRIAGSVEFKALYSNEVAGFISRYLRRLNCSITPDGAAVLADFVGTSLHAVVNEIEKLRTFAGQRTSLVRDDVILASGQTREFNIFQLQRALGKGRAMEVQRIAAHILSAASNKSGEALRMITMLYAYIRRLWILHDISGVRLTPNEKAERLKVNPYFLREYEQALRRTSKRSVEDAIGALLAADYEIKGGARRQPELVVTLLLRRLLMTFAA